VDECADNLPFLLIDGDTYVPQPHARSPWAPDMLHGRLVGGLIARTLEREHGDPDLHFARLTVDLFRNTPLVPLRVTTTRVRDGRRIRVADAVVSTEQGPIGRATVYRTVELLLADRWLARVHWSPEKDSTNDDHAYVPVEQGHQHHMVCKHCGMVAAFEGCDIDALMGGLARRLNFRVDDHWLEIYGVCQSCQRRA